METRPQGSSLDLGAGKVGELVRGKKESWKGEPGEAGGCRALVLLSRRSRETEPPAGEWRRTVRAEEEELSGAEKGSSWREAAEPRC